jgi:hypothetical protein
MDRRRAKVRRQKAEVRRGRPNGSGIGGEKTEKAKQATARRESQKAELALARGDVGGVMSKITRERDSGYSATENDVAGFDTEDGMNSRACVLSGRTQGQNCGF